jgi:hypothetical protein
MTLSHDVAHGMSQISYLAVDVGILLEMKTQQQFVVSQELSFFRPIFVQFSPNRLLLQV